ncbi:hypothetical protein DFH29DRAFT_1011144, partial [Suillus ampliporus]
MTSAQYSRAFLPHAITVLNNELNTCTTIFNLSPHSLDASSWHSAASVMFAPSRRLSLGVGLQPAVNKCSQNLLGGISCKCVVQVGGSKVKTMRVGGVWQREEEAKAVRAVLLKKLPLHEREQLLASESLAMSDIADSLHTAADTHVETNFMDIDAVLPPP